MTAPKTIGPYEIVDLLGRGGMGEVYKAVDVRMYRRPVALKLLSDAMSEDPKALSRFDLEIETAAGLHHPNIVQIYDRGEHEGRRYFAMEFLDGVDLGAVIKDRASRSLEARLELVVQLCDALDYAHGQGVVHRDIKPANIIVLSGGGSEHVKLLDFGIAHVTRSEHTKTTIQPGTLLYMSPEQLKDEPVGPESDLFSLGMVAYELCSGVHPFRARTEYLASSNIMFQKHPPLRANEPSAPEPLERLLDKLLEKDRTQRFGTAAEVAVELRKIVRQMQATAADPEAPSIDNLDQMTGPMVERIVHWARTKEAEGATLEALEAYKRALLLAPAAEWLRSRIARLTERLGSETPEEPAAPDPRGTTSKNRQRADFVAARMAEAETALDEGNLDRASSIAAEILRTYPDETNALALIDRVVLITDRGVPVKAYRRELRAAREALGSGDIAGARKSCDAAIAIWPDDAEAVTLGREIEKARLQELAKAVAACGDAVARVEGGNPDDPGWPALFAEARESLERAEQLGADAPTLLGRREALGRAERRAADLRAEREARDRAAEDSRRAEIRDRLGEADGELAAAEGRVSGDEQACRAALDGVERARAAVARAVGLGADADAAAARRDRADALARAAGERIERLRSDARDRAARLAAIGVGLAEVERLAAGGHDDLSRAAGLLRSLEADLDGLTARGASPEEIAGTRAEVARWGDAVAARRREEDERVARERKERAEREIRERAERERQDRAAREEREEKERAERERREQEARAAKERADKEKRERAERERRERAEREEAKRKERAERAATREEPEASPAPARGPYSALRWAAIGGGAIAIAAAGFVIFHRSGDENVPLPTTGPKATAAPAPAVPPPTEAPPAATPPVAAAPQPAPARPAADVAPRLEAIRRDLGAANGAPMGPLSAIEDALTAADRGIAGAKSVLAADPAQAEARSLLGQLERVRTALADRRSRLQGTRDADLAKASALLDAIEAGLGPGAAPARGAAADCDRAQALVDAALGTDPGSAEARRLAARIGDLRPRLAAPPPPLPKPSAAPARPASPQAAVEALVAAAQKEPLTSRDGTTKRIAADREALESLQGLSGENWAKGTTAQVERDLDTALVWDLFYRYRDAVETRDIASIRRVWPSYPKASADNLARAKGFEYRFADVKVDLGAGTAVLRQTTRQKMDADYWADPVSATVKFALEKRPDGSYVIRSAAAER